MGKIFSIILFSQFVVLGAWAQKNKTPLVVLHTNFGDIFIMLYQNKTPRHAENFIKLTKQGFYDSTTFHRVMNNFMIQGGDPNSKDNNPNNDGLGSPGYTIAAEFNPKLKHILGAVAAARSPDRVNPKKESNGSQFYIVENPNGAHHLDNGYTIFGHVVKGLETVSKIAEVETGMRNRPLEDVVMTAEVIYVKNRKLKRKFNLPPKF